MITRSILTLLLASLFISCQPGTPQEKVESGLLPPVLIKGEKGWSIQERMEFYNVPGVSIAVFKDNQILWAKGYGVMDNETKEPVTEKTLFVAGSISKPVAVAGALRLAQEGTLPLDANVNQLLKSWKLPENRFTAGRPVTLRLLMSHNAGVTVHGFPGYVQGTDVPTIVQILDGASPANTLPIRVDTQPGLIWRYSGGGITIMQLAMCDAAGESFPELMEEKVLKPIGMTESSFEQDFAPDKYGAGKLTADRIKRMASGHKADGSVIPGKQNIYPEMAAAGLWTTPTDLAKFAIEIGLSAKGQSNKVLSQETASLMVTPRVTIEGTTEMALGFFLQNHGSQVYFGHGRQDEGFIATLTANREMGYGAAIMTNSDGRSGPLISEILRSIANEYGWPEYLPAALEEVDVPSDTLSTYAGRYKITTDNVLKVSVDGNRLAAMETEGGEFELVPVSETKFVRQDRKLEYEFFTSGLLAGQVHITGTGPGGQAGFRIEDIESVPQELLRSGRINEAMNGYRALRRTDSLEPAISEQRLNRLGYALLGERKMAEAIAIFKLNAEFYPGSYNTYDSLGEAYMIDGQKELAIRNYERSVQINRQNANGIAMLKKLRGK